MRWFLRAEPGGGRAAMLCLVIASVVGCRSATPLEQAGLEMSPPEGWRPTSPAGLTVPGKPLAAWRGPEGATLVLYRALPAPGASPESLAGEMATRLANLPGVRDLSGRVEPIAGWPAARVELTAPGTGDALAATGMGEPYAPRGKVLVPTHRVCVGWPDPAGPTWLCWHYPESARAAIDPQVAATLQGVRVVRR
jgi:hypothetical protein